jgi:hypothetical protein
MTVEIVTYHRFGSANHITRVVLRIMSSSKMSESKNIPSMILLSSLLITMPEIIEGMNPNLLTNAFIDYPAR